MSPQWYEFPSLILQTGSLARLRAELQDKNLFEAPKMRPKVNGSKPTEEVLRARTPDGTWNDLDNPMIGARGTGFGRNIPLHLTKPDRRRLLEPNPRLISERLMARDEFKPAGVINALAAAWLQFENHGWFLHGNGRPDDVIQVPLRDGDDWPERPMRIRSTQPMEGTPPSPRDRAALYANTETHWWDASQIYGCGPDRQSEIRTFVDGKIKVTDDGRPRENWWVGTDLLHTLFAREHNAVCDELKKNYPRFDDQRLFEVAWLVIAALIAKIHTVEWTTCVLRHPALQVDMNANWHGALDGTFSGIVGSTKDRYSAPFSLTEELVSVYRMHPLIPDEWELHSLESGALLKTFDFTDIQGPSTHDVMDQHEMGDLWYSFGLASAGALCLHNYPNALRRLTRIDGQVTDLATLDIVRDRERGVPRYNDFREALRMPRRKTFDQLTPNPVWAREIYEVYNGDVDAVDLQVGLYAERPPRGFGFSDTASRIVILMASRRLESDRFFTTDFRPEVYTKVGFDWVNNTSMKDVLLRHHPELQPVIGDVERVFAPW